MSRNNILSRASLMALAIENMEKQFFSGNSQEKIMKSIQRVIGQKDAYFGEIDRATCDGIKEGIADRRRGQCGLDSQCSVVP